MPERSAGQDAIRVEGLASLQRALRGVDKNLPRLLRIANLKGAEIVAVRSRAAFGNLPGVGPKVVDSVKAVAEQRSASVRIGGKRYPFALGAEFGGQRRSTTQQFQPWRGKGTGAGYALFPSIRASREQLLDAYGGFIDELTADAFPT